MTLRPEWSDADRMELATTLRELRRAAGLSGQALGAKVFMSQAKVSRIENGRIVPSTTDVELMVHALGVAPEQSRELVGLARVANSEYRSGRLLEQRGVGARQRDHLALERQARLTRYFLPTMLAGAVQIPAYTRQAVSGTPRLRPAGVVDEVMAGKALRRHVLDDADREFVFLHTEGALRWRLVDAAGMAEQMEYLAAAGERPNVSVEVIPFDATVPAGPLNMFVIYDDRLVAIEVKSGMLMLRDPVDIARYSELFDFYRRHALRGGAARDFVLSVAEDYRRSARN